MKVNVSRVRVAFGAPKPNVERVVLTGWPLENCERQVYIKKEWIIVLEFYRLVNTCHRPKEIDDGHWRYVNGSAYSEIEYTCNGSLVKSKYKIHIGCDRSMFMVSFRKRKVQSHVQHLGWSTPVQ